MEISNINYESVNYINYLIERLGWTRTELNAGYKKKAILTTSLNLSSHFKSNEKWLGDVAYKNIYIYSYIDRIIIFILVVYEHEDI